MYYTKKYLDSLIPLIYEDSTELNTFSILVKTKSKVPL